MCGLRYHVPCDFYKPPLVLFPLIFEVNPRESKLLLLLWIIYGHDLSYIVTPGIQ